VDILALNNRLLQGILIAEINPFPTFKVIKSVFTDRWYNLITPTTDSGSFDWEQAAQVIRKEKKLGFEFSYYIKINDNYEGFARELQKRGCGVVMTDILPVKEITHPFNEVSCEVTPVTADLEGTYVDISSACFPDWDNNREFCRRLFKAQKKKGDKMVANYLIHKKGQFAGIYSVITSSSLNLSYLTNMGTLPKFRGQGIQTEAIRFHCNHCLEIGIPRVFAIVEPGSVSLHNFEKLGFRKEARYDTFFRKD
jgi:hypothetical protein